MSTDIDDITYYGVERFVEKIGETKDKNIDYYDDFAREINVGNIEIKTAFGLFSIDLYNKCISNLTVESRIIIDYILSHWDKKEFNGICDMLKTTDIGIIIFNDNLYVNIDSDIAKWIWEYKPDDLLFRAASGYSMVQLPTAMVIKFYRKYIRSYKNYEEKASLLNLASNCEESLKNSIEYYKYNDITISNKNEEINKYSRTAISRSKTSIRMSVAVHIINSMIYKMGYHKDMIDVTTSVNDVYNYYNTSNFIDINSILMQVWKYQSVEYVDEFLDMNDIDAAIEELKELSGTYYYKCRGLYEICKFLNINLESLVGKLLVNIDIIQGVILCVAERNKYKQGYFNYQYTDCKMVNDNKYSTKAFIRLLIEEFNKDNRALAINE